MYEQMWDFMQRSEPSVFVANTQEGIRRVQEGGYAFMMESTTLDYLVRRQCDLMQVGGLLNSKGYGIGTPMGKSLSATFVAKSTNLLDMLIIV